ncbi:MAG: hypothetical protein V9G98_11940 [Candidatus Competibacter sp.]
MNCRWENWRCNRHAAPASGGGNAAAKNQEEPRPTYAARAHATGAGNVAGAASRSDGGTATGIKTSTIFTSFRVDPVYQSTQRVLADSLALWRTFWYIYICHFLAKFFAI